MNKVQDTRSRLPCESTLESGDRFELVPLQPAGTFRLPDYLRATNAAIRAIVDENSQPLATTVHPQAETLMLSGARPLAGGRAATFWLEYQGDDRFCLVVEGLPADNGEVRTEQGIVIALEPHDQVLVAGPAPPRISWEEFELGLQAARLASHPGFDQLICLPMVRDMELLEHQLRTARVVLQRFRGRALLCDEVGLGKTIEAGLIFAELRLRGLVRSALVLTPPSLIEQWQGEMRRKFALELAGPDDPAFRQHGRDAWGSLDFVIASSHTAKREPHRSAILGRKWDLVIVDEAHHLRNRNTQLWRFASELQKQYILLLTATPVQNNLEELFNLVTLLEPGLLRTARQFQRQFVDRRDKLAPKNVDELHRLLAEVMVRNRRSTVGLQFTRRWAQTIRVAPTEEERALYQNVADFVRRHLREAKAKGALSRMALLALQMGLGSSPQAAAGTLERLTETPDLAEAERHMLSGLARQARSQPAGSKVEQLLRVLREFSDKMVIFTQFRATQEMLAEQLRQAGEQVAVFHGGLSRLAKEAAVEQFRGSARLLLATESGSEGRNLQFAHAICNFDLPWNPQRIEQRIGRLSRIGQTHDVSVFNLVAAGTIEAAVLHLLEAKLNMFELVIGEIDMILGNLEEDQEFPDLVADLWAESSDLADFSRRMEELGNRLVAAKEAYLEQRGYDDKLFGDRFTPGR